MSRHVRRIVFGTLIVLAVASAAVGTAAYAVRDRLHNVPVIGAFFKNASAPYWTCPMHPDVHSDYPGQCPKCGMTLVQATADVGSSVSEDAGLEARAPVVIDGRRQQLVGVRTAEVTRQPMSKSVRATGVVKVDETRQADVNVKVDGWIEALYVDYTGRPVSRGEPLFAIYSPELVAAQNEYLLAIKSREQTSGSQVEDARQLADRLVAAARNRLSIWDLPEGQIETLERTHNVTRTIVFRSPVSGVVVEKQAIKGMRVMPGQSLYRIVDLSRVWVEADVYAAEISMLKPGTQADVTIDTFPGRHFNARLTFVAPVVDEATRTVRARFELVNPRGELKPGMFAAVAITSPSREALVVPTDSVLDTGRRQVVFIADGDGHYTPRDVKTGARIDGHVEVLDGLAQGQRVAASALFFLDSESQLRAALEGYESNVSEGAVPVTAADAVRIEFATDPDPLKSGQAGFTVNVRDASGQPVADAEVSVTFYMPPMPSMNMPAMRSETRLSSVGQGEYRGSGEVMSTGRWDITVTVTRAGARLGARRLTLVAR